MAGTVYFSVQDGIAIRGYDPVSFFFAETPARGHRSHAVMWKGAVWLFQSAENQSRFESNPRAFAPRFGGHCAYGMARGRMSDGDPLAWEIVDGQLFLFHNQRVEDLWRANHDAMIQAARAVWPDILRGE
ncbi:twin-arginine translocation pathway signal protein [Phaeobacter sp. B1627]|nr:twin-arginine translocation pathway signal protein [Phaeobacter sp. B1627]